MNNPFFWLGISILLVAISLIALLTVAVLTLQELARAARSAEKLLDTLNRELPATLNDLRLTGQELSGLSDEVSSGVQSARSVVEQVDRGMVEARVQAQRAQITTRSLFVGASAALKVLVNGTSRRRRRPPTRRPLVPPIASDPTAWPPQQTVSAQPPAEQHISKSQISEKASVALPNFSHKSTEHKPTERPAAEKATNDTHQDPPLPPSS